MSPLPRELVRWLQTLDLPTTVRLPKRDLCNGYLFAEMCARYWNGVELHSFENKLSKANKDANWKVLRRYFAKNQFNVDEMLIQGVINCEDSAAEQFLFQLYTALTKREIQIIPAAHEPEVDSVPVFVKSQYSMQQQHTTQRRQDETITAEQEEQRQAEERARLEAQRRAEAQQRQQHPSKPKTLSKAQAIQAPGEDGDHDGATHHAVQFSAVTVKPLPPQMLARFGNRGGAGDSSAGGAAGGKGKSGGGGAGSDDAPGAVATISATLTKILDEGGLPLWTTSSSVPTAADYFFKHLTAIDPNLRNVMWSQLLSSSNAVAIASAFFSSIYDGLNASSTTSSNTISDGSGSPLPSSQRPRSDFLLVLHSVLEGFASRKRSGIDEDNSSSSRPASVVKLNEQCAAVAYYNAVAGLYSESSRDRLSATKILTRLVRLGAYESLSTQRHLRTFSESLLASHHRAAWTMTADGLIAYAQLAEAHLDFFLSPESGSVEDHGALAEDVHHAINAIRAVALNDDAVVPSNARQYMLVVLAKATALFPPPSRQQGQQQPSGEGETALLSSQLAAYMVHSEFVRDHATVLLGSGSDEQQQQEAAVTARSSSPTVIVESRVLGAVAIPTLLRAACPLRLALGLLLSTPVERPAENPTVSPTPAPPGVKKHSTPAAASSNSIAKTASRILKQGDLNELALGRLQWTQALFTAHQDAALATRTLGHVNDEDLVSQWWDVVKQLEPTLGVVLYAAELLASQQQQLQNANTSANSSKSGGGGASAQQQLPAPEVVAAVFNAAGIAQSILIRCYIDFSGQILPAPSSLAEYIEIRQDGSIASRAMEWFQQVVVES
ncbi:Hypothetical protein, putative [Bodo saltans]|uniref:CH-like domain-containing protein n=1 Tax=Bodo saltans TaxID=75058 RepID=A0A0S4JL90_BODSA|nr:Hypothetical protein, putative [Bodo saltans]|eukprot:CUG90891.1 Hypothetical protein, putative [Bodo saltans]